MDYARFVELCRRVKDGALSPDAAAQLVADERRQPAAGGTERFLGSEPFLADHLVDAQPVLIGVTYGALAIRRHFDRHAAAVAVHVSQLDFRQPVVVAPQAVAEIVLRDVEPGVAEAQEGFERFEAVCNGGSRSPIVAATGRVRTLAFEPARHDVPALWAGGTPFAALDRLYADRGGLRFGPSYKTLTELRTAGKRAIGRVAIGTPGEAGAAHRYVLHPLFINSGFLAVQALLGGVQELYLPFGIRDIHCARTAAVTHGWVLVELLKQTEELVLFDIECLDDEGRRLAHLRHCALKRRRAAAPALREAATAAGDGASVRARDPAPAGGDLGQAISAYLVERLAHLAGRSPQEIDPSRNVMDMGLASAQVIELGGEVQRDFGIELLPTVFFEYTSVAELSAHLLEQHGPAFAAKLAVSDVQPGVGFDGGPPAQAAAAPTRGPASPAAAEGREPIAIVGMNGRFAGSPDVETFWQHLCAQTELMREVPLDHWDTAPWFDADPNAPDKTYCKWGSFIDGVDEFDASFFNIARREAEWIDPQIRLLLQSVYAAAEDAGCAGALRGSRTGVFVGACFHDYQHKIDELNLPVNPHVGVNNTHTVMANRVSYHFNLLGPSVTVDTACSSSLVALHQACLALRAGECDLAMVSGANLLLSSLHYRVFSSLKALSPTGRCHTFDAGADGYVPGECVATVVLKPLSKAIADGDRIHALVRGSAALHGGYTPSLTAPSVSGEENVVLQAWKDADLDPETLGYIEAHGTGTKLGDPIEINALKNAFGRHTQRRGFCSVGSVKSNIGHAEGAAGIAGLLKVVMQMRHGRIPPLMGFTTLNPYIVLGDSALRIDAHGAEWPRDGQHPRRAGISSFGVAGAYAHVVVEEYTERPAPREDLAPGLSPVLLSARTPAALEARVRQLHEWLGTEAAHGVPLRHLAATLLGREAMECRLAFQVDSIAALRDMLGRIHRGDLPAGVFRGQAPRSMPSAVLAAPAWPQDAGAALERWVAGGAVDWRAARGPGRLRVVPLPTYPFARERYWIPREALEAAAAMPQRPQAHGTAAPTGTRQHRFDGTEFFLADHRLGADAVLPGVVHLELARAALAAQAGTAGTGWMLSGVVWSRPVRVRSGTPAVVAVEIDSDGVGEWRYQVTNGAREGGRVVFSRGHGRTLPPGLQPGRLDLEALRAQCRVAQVTSRECYAQIAAMGLALGPRLQGIHAMHLGEGELLADLRLPDQAPPVEGPYVLHPTLADSALQACATLLTRHLGGTARLALPHALRSLEVHGALAPRMWAHVRLGASGGEGGLPEVDIDLCDESGQVRASMHGVSFRFAAAPAEAALPDVLMVHPVWREAAANPVAEPASPLPLHMMFMAVDPERVRAAEQARAPQVSVSVSLSDDDPALALEQACAAFLSAVQEAARVARGGVRLQVLVAGPFAPSVGGALVAAMKSAQAEFARLQGQVVEIGIDAAGQPAAAVAPPAPDFTAADIGDMADMHVAWRAGRRWVRRIEEIVAPLPAPVAPWRDHATYLITGGLGALGLAVAEEIARRTTGATLVLAGRNPPGARAQERIDALVRDGVRVHLRSADFGVASQVHALVSDLLRTQGRLHGVIHCAGVLDDRRLAEKTAAGCARVLAPKAAGLVHLERSLAGNEPDLFIAFSSIAALLGNAGQLDYAAANAFMDEFIRDRAAAAGATRWLSVDWPVWSEGTMRPSAAVEALFSRTYGLQALPTHQAFDAMYRALALGQEHVAVLAGSGERMRERVLRLADNPAGAAPPVEDRAHAGRDAGRVDAARAGEFVRDLAAEVLRLRAADMDLQAEFDTYGFTSIALTEYLNAINRQLDLDLTPAVFYDHSTLERFAEYLLLQHGPALARRLGANADTSQAPAPVPTAPSGQRPERPAAPAPQVLPSAGGGTDVDDAVAIIGASGAFPQAPNLDAFWQNLVDGRDSITEIPPSRWDWRAIDGDPHAAGNRSNVKWGAFLGDAVAEFDPLFFGISPREAECMDPQQRLLMTHAWLAIEDAGYSSQSLSGTRTAVFVGTTSTGYGGVLARHQAEVQAQTATGLVPSLGPNRLSYFLNLHGPSEPVETACSSALVAVHRGVRALRSGECEMALVGAVNTIFDSDLHISFNKAGMLAQDGRCKPFSAAANGFARGEGVGVLLLKPLHRALRDGDAIRAVIRGSAQNHGGRAKSLTAPSPKAQADLLTQAFADAGVAPSTIGYIEAHGTGTALGDPIEVEGLRQAFARAGGMAPAVPDGRCALGSVKSNLGHLELAAGMAGLLKVMLQLEHRSLVRTLHCEQLNPHLKLAATPFYVVQENADWPALRDASGQALPRRAGVSSFGFGGTNCHVVLEEAPAEAPLAAAPAAQPVAMLLSARNPERLRERALALLAHLESPAGAAQSLQDIAYTLQVGRDAMASRLAWVARTHAEAASLLRSHLADESPPPMFAGQATRANAVAALFAGDEALAAALEAMLAERRFAKLAALWVQGVEVDWARLYGSQPARRVHLPGYPFEKGLYWAGASAPGGVPAAEAGAAGLGVVAPAGAEGGLPSPEPEHAGKAVRYVHKVWRPLDTAGGARRDLSGPVLILADPASMALAERLASRLAQARVLDVQQPVDDADLDIGRWQGVIDVVGCSEASDLHVAHTLAPLQRLLASAPPSLCWLLGVTRGLAAVGTVAPSCTGATRAALYRMLGFEHPGLSSRHIDVDPGADLAAQCDAVLAEAALADAPLEVARRGSRRLAAGHEAFELPANDVELRFDAAQPLWVTGGTQGLGHRVARHFVERHGVRRLVLTSRTPLPPRSEWPLHQDKETPMGQRVRAVQALERAGATVMVLAVDLASPEEVRAAVAEVHAQFGPVGGVVHCAGAVDRVDPAFACKTPGAMRAVLEPKVRGLQVLHAALQDDPLRFFVCFSSVAAAIAPLGTGLSDYAMANAYMDAFARAHASQGPIVSIQWPSWSQSGMRAPTGQAYRARGLLTLDDALGLRLLDHILAERAGPVVMAACVDAAHWNPATWSLAPRGPRAASAPAVAAPVSQGTYVGRDGAVRWLTQFFARELKIPAASLRPDVPFHDYGMESVMLAQVISRLGRELDGLALDPTVVLENPTIGQLANHLVEHHTHLAAIWELPAPAMPASTGRPGEAGGEDVEVRPEPPPVTRTAGRVTVLADERSVRTKGPAEPVRQAPSTGRERIAVIGLAAHLPDAPDAATFWRNLMNGVDSIREVPPSRWSAERFYSPVKGERGKSISKWGAFLDDIESFDPEFFKMPESLVLQMDPLERQWLEVSAEALADAGYGGAELAGRRVGVFAGSRTANYRDKLAQIDKDVVVGLGQNFIAAHLAHVYDFKGPNLVVDAACASALTAIHLAVESLRRGESEVALAGGVDVLLDESPYVVLSAAQVLSPDGRCKTFDERANGIGLGEGCAVLVLKPLARALADGDKVYGVIEGSAINNDGRTMGITTPNPQAQCALIESALADAGVDAATLSYVETHGTGTLIGDPIELNALTRVLRVAGDRQGVCGVGSVKSNVGHLLSAAGGAGMVKLLLSLVHRTLPPTLHCGRPNPRFDFGHSPLYPVLEARPWRGNGPVLRAGISAFGLGGNNAHVVVSDEGVPDALRATLVPRGTPVRFKRRRIWPTPATPAARVVPAYEPEPVAVQAPASAAPFDAGLRDFFDVRRVPGVRDTVRDAA